VQCWWIRGWSAARQLADVAEPARGGWVSEVAAAVLCAATRQGRALSGYLREEGSGEEAKGNSASAWQLRGDKDVTRTWRRQLNGLRMERTWRAVDRADVRWRAVNKPPRCCLACGHGLAWATSKRALRTLLIFFKIFHLPNFKIQNNDLSYVKNSPIFVWG
jgi:hypothetical protein